MAEFQDVMRQWCRMCGSVPGKETANSICRDKRSGYICPMHDCGLCNKTISEQTDDDRLQGEKTIMKWASEHPEPVYPTWVVWLVEIGVLPEKMSAIPSMALEAVKEGLTRPIPADIAQKLGLEPKER